MEWSTDEILMQESRSVNVSVMDDYDVREERCMFFATCPYLLTSDPLCRCSAEQVGDTVGPRRERDNTQCSNRSYRLAIIRA